MPGITAGLKSSSRKYAIRIDGAQGCDHGFSLEGLEKYDRAS
jgi:hypothetical protein